MYILPMGLRDTYLYRQGFIQDFPFGGGEIAGGDKHL